MFVVKTAFRTRGLEMIDGQGLNASIKNRLIYEHSYVHKQRASG